MHFYWLFNLILIEQNLNKAAQIISSPKQTWEWNNKMHNYELSQCFNAIIACDCMQ